jgi:hypothetical protein
MRLVSWLWFSYFLLGFVAGGCVMYLWVYFKEKAIKFKWFEWILSILIFLIFVFMGQTFIGSIDEGEIQAAWMSLLFMGVPIVILIVLTYRSIKARI